MAENFVTEMFRKIDSRDWEALPGSFAEDAVYERPGYAPLQGIDRIMKTMSGRSSLCSRSASARASGVP